MEKQASSSPPPPSSSEEDLPDIKAGIGSRSVSLPAISFTPGHRRELLPKRLGPMDNTLRAKSVSALRASNATPVASWEDLKNDHKKLCISLEKRIALNKDAYRVPEFVGIGLAIIGGIFVITQVGVNTSLRRTLIPSALATSAFSFSVGLITITILNLIHKFPTQVGVDLYAIPWYAFSGGLLGALFVTTSILLAPVLGFATFQLAVVTGQLVSGIICDMAGFLHLDPSKPTPWRLFNVSGVIAGTALSVKWDSSDEDNTWELPVYLLLAALAGSIFPIQACVNYELAQHVGTPYRAVMINFLVGTVAMWVAVLVESFTTSQPIIEQQDDEDIDYRWWLWTGGVFGALLIAAITMGIPSLGAVRFTAMFISTQLLAAVIADALGLFGYEIVPLNAFGGRRIIGTVIAILAAVCFKFNPPESWKYAREWPCTAWNTMDEELFLSEDELIVLPSSSFHVAVALNHFLGEETNRASEPSVADLENNFPKNQPSSE